MEKVLSGKKKKKKTSLFPIQNFYFLNISLYLVKERITFFYSFVGSLLLSCQPTLNLYSFVVRKGMLFAPHSIGLRRKFVHILFVFPFYFKCMQNKHINCNRKCLLYSKTYSGFVLIALIWKRRKSQIKCLQRQFWGFCCRVRTN